MEGSLSLPFSLSLFCSLYYINLSIYLFQLSVSIYLFIYLPIYLSIYRPINLSIYHLFIYLGVFARSYFYMSVRYMNNFTCCEEVGVDKAYIRSWCLSLSRSPTFNLSSSLSLSVSPLSLCFNSLFFFLSLSLPFSQSRISNVQKTDIFWDPECQGKRMDGWVGEWVCVSVCVCLFIHSHLHYLLCVQ